MSRVREFFGPRAAAWDARFPDDEPAFAAAVRALSLPVGGAALDAGCGTARAVGALRDAVGESGTVVAVDATPEMLEAAVSAGRSRMACLVLGDVAEVPVRAASIDGVLAAGLITHLTDPLAGLRRLAGVTRVGGRLALFHPIGRAALAERHGHPLRPDDIRAPENVRAAFETTGWQTVDVDDSDTRYLAVARRI